MTWGGVHHHADCRDILQRTSEFIDHELADADYAQIQAHLDECAPCLQYVDVQRLVKSLVARSCVERAPVELRQRVVLELRQGQLNLQPRRLDLD
jgi:mycothiol system anti-sigma-R factor